MGGDLPSFGEGSIRGMLKTLTLTAIVIYGCIFLMYLR